MGGSDRKKARRFQGNISKGCPKTTITLERKTPKGQIDPISRMGGVGHFLDFVDFFRSIILRVIVLKSFLLAS